MTPPGESQGGSGRRSGRRSHEPLQHIGIGGGLEPADDAEYPDDPESELDEAELELDELPDEPEDAADASRPAARRVHTTRISEPARPRSVRSSRGPGLDRIKPRAGAGGSALPADLRPGTERDPMGRAALYSSGPKAPEPILGTFLLECSACRRETPVTAGDLLRLGVPSFHLPIVKRYPSLMRCPACGRWTWLRVHWRI